MDISGRFLVNIVEVGVGGTMIIVAVPDKHVPSGASEWIFEGGVLVEQVLQCRLVVWGFPWVDRYIRESKKTCIDLCEVEKSLVYTPLSQLIIPPGQKLQRRRSLATAHARR